MKRVEIAKRFDEIVDFAGVEKFLDTPVKRYSSGMYVRLAFAVATQSFRLAGALDFDRDRCWSAHDSCIFISPNGTAVRRRYLIHMLPMIKVRGVSKRYRLGERRGHDGRYPRDTRASEPTLYANSP
jgi:hypothetical protein